MSKYHTASAAFDKDAGIIREISSQLAGMLGAGADTLSEAMAAIKKLGVDAVRKLIGALRGSLSGLGQGVRSRFAKAILTVALASGALMAQGCVAAMTVRIGDDVSYRDYSRRPHVVHVLRAGLPERDVARIYVHIGGSRRRHDRNDRNDRPRVRRTRAPQPYRGR